MNSDDEAEEERRAQEEAAMKQASKDTTATATSTSWDIKREACGTAAAEGKSLLVVRFSKQQLQ